MANSLAFSYKTKLYTLIWQQTQLEPTESMAQFASILVVPKSLANSPITNNDTMI